MGNHFSLSSVISLYTPLLLCIPTVWKFKWIEACRLLSSPLRSFTYSIIYFPSFVSWVKPKYRVLTLGFHSTFFPLSSLHLFLISETLSPLLFIVFHFTSRRLSACNKPETFIYIIFFRVSLRSLFVQSFTFFTQDQDQDPHWHLLQYYFPSTYIYALIFMSLSGLITDYSDSYGWKLRGRLSVHKSGRSWSRIQEIWIPCHNTVTV